MGASHNIPYRDIVAKFTDACNEHIQINSFDTGTLDYLDASSQNTIYPYVYLRPIGSTGISGNVRSLTFELYSLDIPKLSQESPVELLSDSETRIYDIVAYFNRGGSQQDYEVTMSAITPVNEAFNDRAFGWVSVINVLTPYKLDYCNYPKV